MFKLLVFILLPLFSSSAQTLTLKDALKLVPKHPKQQSYNLDTQNAEIGRTKSWLNLTPSISGAWQKSSTSTIDDLANPTWKLSAGLNLFSSFGDYTNIRAKGFLLAATESTEDWALNQNELQLAETYLNCLYEQNAEAAALEALKISEQIAAIEQSRFKKGIKSRDDFLKLKVDAENRRIRYLSELTKKESCYSELSYWVGSFLALADPKLNPKEPVAKSGLPSEHPRLKAAQLALESNRSLAHSTVTTNLPRLDLSVGRSYYEVTESYGNEIYLTAKWNLFDSGQTLSDIRAGFVQLRKSEETLKDTERDLTKEISVHSKNLTQYLKQYKIAEENLRDIQLTFKTSLARFRAGAISANEVALDQARVVDATFAVYNLWLQMNLSYLRYQSSIGNKVSQVLGEQK